MLPLPLTQNHIHVCPGACPPHLGTFAPAWHCKAHVTRPLAAEVPATNCRLMTTILPLGLHRLTVHACCRHPVNGVGRAFLHLSNGLLALAVCQWDEEHAVRQQRIGGSEGTVSNVVRHDPYVGAVCMVLVGASWIVALLPQRRRAEPAPLQGAAGDDANPGAVDDGGFRPLPGPPQAPPYA